MYVLICTWLTKSFDHPWNGVPLRGQGGVSLQKFVFLCFSISDSPEYGEPGTFYGIEKACSVA